MTTEVIIITEGLKLVKGDKGDEGGTSALTVDGNLLTRVAGAPGQITRADLAADAAFTSRYAPIAETTDWVACELQTGWTAYGNPYQVPRYRKWLGVVHIQGLAQNTSGGPLGAANDIFFLPAGFRPAASLTVPPFAVSSMEIKSNGGVAVNNNIGDNGFVAMSFSFLPEPV